MLLVFGLDISLLFGRWGLGQWLFRGYEAHICLSRKLLKLTVLSDLLLTVCQGLGRGVFYGLLGLLSLDIVFLHGLWFHKRHGIHWRKAEPRDKDLRLTGVLPSEKDEP